MKTKISETTQKVLDYIILHKDEKDLSTEELISDGVRPKQIAAAISVLVRKNIITESPFKTNRKNYLKNASATNIDELKKLVSDFLALKTYSVNPLVAFLRNNPEEYKIMQSVTGEKDRIVQSLWHFVYGNDIPNCQRCGEEVVFNDFNSGYDKFCCNSCSSVNYWDNATDDFIKERTIKLKKTFLERTGEDWCSKTQEHRDKIKATSIKKFGCTHFTQNEEVINKSKETFDKLYGGQGAASPLIAEKIKSTTLKNHGVEYAWQIPGVQDKIQASRFALKDYVFPSGRIEKVQGYEPRALDMLLLEGISEEDIVVSRQDISDLIGPIFYEKNGQKSRYFPDFYIKSLNLVVEVKSLFTYNGYDHDEVLLKREATIALGFNYRFMVFEGSKLLDI